MSGAKRFDVINPATGETVRRYDGHDDAQAVAIVEAAAKAHRSWRRTSFAERAAVLRRAAEILREREQRYAELMAVEMGKPLAGGLGEVRKCAWVCEHYAEHAEAYLAPRTIESDASNSYVAHQPLGVVLAVMPWNFPFWQVFRFLAPALMAGNGGALKHASNVPGCALAIEEIVRDAGLPKDVFRTLLIGASQVPALIAHRAIAAVTLTGSTPAGKAVAAAAGAALKKTVLELGGSDPYVILEDADLAQAAEICATSRLINSGQSCIAAKRFIVVDSVHDAFVEELKAALAKRTVGDPLAEGTDVGPQARVDLRDELHDQVRRSVEAGAELALGGAIPDGPGAYYPVTLLTNVTADTPAYHEELFGPVGSVIRASDEPDAIRIANDSVFGLGAAVFTRDLERGRRIAEEELEAGCCFVNSFVKSDPRLPFGGIKESGYGRELAGLGIRELINQKTVYVA